MRSLVGNMAIDDKFFKDVLLERLWTSGQKISTSDSDDLDISKLAEMADPVMEVGRLSSATVAQVSQPLTAFTSDLAGLKTQTVQLSANVAASQLRRSAGPSRHSYSRDRRSRSRPRYHLNFGDIRHIDGSRNEVADALSRPSLAHRQLAPGIELAVMVAEKRRVGSSCDEDVSGLQFQELPLTTGNGTTLCDVSTQYHRPFVPPSTCRKVYSSLHNLSYSGSRATGELVSTASSGMGCTRTSKHGHGLVPPVNGVKSTGRTRPPLAPSPALVKGSATFTWTL
ncbi:hypothetical protein SprV_0301305900 [Sparganum proliferum]